jgi:release factor glutamine methyltransferase
MTVGAALLQGAALLESASIPAHRLTAEVLLAHAIGCERVWLYAHSEEELREVWWIHYGRYLHERMQGKPTQQITGKQEFYGREFRVTRDVLIPRPETEHVIEAVLALAPDACRVLDVGAGSGAIAVTLALELAPLGARAAHGLHVVATDISAAALRIAAENAQRLSAQVGFVRCDLGAAFAPESFDLVVSNPPYVPEREKSGIQREVRDFEPDVALYGGDDGFAIYRRLIPGAGRILHPGGWLIMEIGYASAETVRELLSGWMDVQIRADIAGLARVIAARKPAG